MPPDSKFINLVGKESVKSLKRGEDKLTLVVDLGKVTDAEMEVLENQKMRGIPVWWDKPIYVAFIAWVPDAMAVMSEGVLVSYSGELVVVVKTRLSTKEFNRLVNFGKVNYI